jgi:hypothetical protein
MDLKEKRRRPSTTRRVLRGIERGLNAVDHKSLNAKEREDHEIALRWLKRIRRYNRWRVELRQAWVRERGRRGDECSL